jgi:homoserine kinase
VGLSDRLHEPYRAPLIGPVAEALAAARLAGAVGGFISGSGSTLAAFVMDSSVDLEQVARAMCVPFEAIGITCVPRVARPRDGGAWDDVRAQAG